MLTFSDLLNGAKGPKEVMDAFELAQEAMGLFSHLEGLPRASSDMEQRRLHRIWCKANVRLYRRKEALDAELDAFNAFPTFEDLEQTYPGLQEFPICDSIGIPFGMEYIMSLQTQLGPHYSGLRIIRVENGYNLANIPY